MSSITPIKFEPQNILLNEYIKQEYNDETTEYDYSNNCESIYNWFMQDFKYITENIKTQNIKIKAEIIDNEVCTRENDYVSSINMCHMSTTYDIKNEPISCNLDIKGPPTINITPPKHKVVRCKEKQYFSQNKLSVEKPYKCKICKKSFSLKGNLKTHFWIHMQEKPFNCDIWKKSYTQKVNLKTHMRSHMSKKSNTSNKTFLQKKSTTENIKTQNIKIKAEIIDNEVCTRENDYVSSINMCHMSTTYDIKNEPISCNLDIKGPPTINITPPKHKVVRCKEKQYFSQNKLSV